MPGLTVTEKEHGKGRIAKRIDKRIDALVAAEPNLFDRVHRAARERALDSLGLAEWQSELDAICKNADQAQYDMDEGKWRQTEDHHVTSFS